MDWPHLHRQLLAWFAEHGRDLPWRHSYDPYQVWVSEIMLQQTQMDRVVGYFERFIKRFPDIASLAQASDDQVLKQWEGLGYYNRARNLLSAARQLASESQGLPASYPQLLKLPGIGPYTASAILAIGFDQPQVVVDGNVERLFARLLDMATMVKERQSQGVIQQAAEQAMAGRRPRCFNQAMMEFGALVCRPGQPLCGRCPFPDQCLAHERGTIGQRPVLPQRKKTIYIDMACGVVHHHGQVLIQKRLAGDVWAGLWEFPGGQMEEGEAPEQTVVRELQEETELQEVPQQEITTVQHAYMHYQVTLHGFFCGLRSDPARLVLHAAQEARWVRPEQLADYAFPAGHRKLISYMAEQALW